MSIIDGGFPRIKHKVACDEDLRFRENRIKTNRVSAVRADTERPPAECRAQLLTTILERLKPTLSTTARRPGTQLSTNFYKLYRWVNNSVNEVLYWEIINVK